MISPITEFFSGFKGLFYAWFYVIVIGSTLLFATYNLAVACLFFTLPFAYLVEKLLSRENRERIIAKMKRGWWSPPSLEELEKELAKTKHI